MLMWPRRSRLAPSMCICMSFMLPRAVFSCVSPQFSPPQSLVCHFCWNTGLFATEPFQQAWDGRSSYSGFAYTTTWTQIQSSTDAGCQWCKLLLSARTDSMLQDAISVTVGFRSSSGSHGVTPKGVHTLRLVVGDAPHFVYYAYADRGRLTS